MPSMPIDLTTLEALAILCVVALAGVIVTMFWDYRSQMRAENGYLKQMVDTSMHTMQSMAKGVESMSEDMAEIRRAMMERKR